MKVASTIAAVFLGCALFVAPLAMGYILYKAVAPIGESHGHHRPELTH